VAEAQTDRLLGGVFLASEGLDSVQTLAMALISGMMTKTLGETNFPYLTTVEGLRLAVQTLGKDVAELSRCGGWELTFHHWNTAYCLTMNRKLIIDAPFYAGEAEYSDLARNIHALDPTARIDWLAGCRLVQVECTCDPDLVLVAVQQTGLISGSVLRV
jgi:hypothetical protein